MQVIVKGKNVEVTPALRAHAEKRSSKVEKLFDKRLVEVQVTLRIERGIHICDVTVLVDGLFMRGEDRSSDMYSSIDGAYEKVERQIRKHKTRINDRLRPSGSIISEAVELEPNQIDSDTTDGTEINVARVKRFPVKPMDVEEAVMQMELLGHDFFVYRDQDTDGVCVVYRRKDGGYGLIEPELS
jgi:putative sigma-54 modulation protein